MARHTKGKMDSLTIRIHPKVKYMIALLARKQRRTMGSVIEWLVLEAEKQQDDFNVEELWDVSEAERLRKLAAKHPDLLTYDEELILKE